MFTTLKFNEWGNPEDILPDSKNCQCQIVWQAIGNVKLLGLRHIGFVVKSRLIDAN